MNTHGADHLVLEDLGSNGWWDSGHEFFIQPRILCWLDHPVVAGCLAPSDRRLLEAAAEAIQQLVPRQPASLVHGDLWSANMLFGPGGHPSWFDPRRLSAGQRTTSLRVSLQALELDS